MALEDLLAELGPMMGLGPLKLDENNVCRLRFGDDLVVDIEHVPSRARFFLHAEVGVAPAAGSPLLRDMLAANLFGAGTGDATLAVDTALGEVLLLRGFDENGTDASGFAAALELFLTALEEWRGRLLGGERGRRRRTAARISGRPDRSSAAETRGGARMSQSVGGLNKAKVGGFQGAEGTQPPSGTGDLAGKKVTAGDVFKTIGRVALGLVTLGVSELVIRLVQRAQRQPPEVVPTKGPGKAAQTLAPAGAPPKGNDGSGSVPTGDTLARSTGPSATGRAWRDRAPAARRGRGEPATEAEGRSAQGAGAADLRDVLGRGEERHASERQGRQDRLRDVPHAVRRGTGRPLRLHELRIPRLERSSPQAAR